MESDRQDEQRGDEEQGLGRRGHYARRRLVCQVLEVTGQESRSLGIGRRGRGGFCRMHVGLWELCSGRIIRRTNSDVELAVGTREKDFSSERGTCPGFRHGEGKEGKGRQGQEVGERDNGVVYGCAEQCVDREYSGRVIERESDARVLGLISVSSASSVRHAVLRLLHNKPRAHDEVAGQHHVDRVASG
jgi:hypothetical protein